MQGQIPVLAAATLAQMAQIRADFLRHGAQQSNVQRAFHEIVNLAQP